jgi:hypothetical protein
MKTPVNVVLMAILYWILIYAVLIVPKFSNAYMINLVWVSMVIPNVLRLMVGSIPRLAVDKFFFVVSTIFALGITYLVGQYDKGVKEGLSNSSATTDKKVRASVSLVMAFIIGALMTYFLNIDSRIYSEMGWES